MSIRSIPENTKQALDTIDFNFNDILNQFRFYLAGGTALSLQIDHRISYDLDFFTQTEFDPNNLLNKFSNLEIDNVQTSFGTLKFTLNGCFISFFFYPYLLLKEFNYLENYKVNLCSKLDIGLMKITAIADRGVKKDFVDLYFISKELGGLKEVLSYFKDKFPTANFYHYIKSLSYFEIADNDPDLNMLIDINWKEIKNYFLLESRTLIN